MSIVRKKNLMNAPSERIHSLSGDVESSCDGSLRHSYSTHNICTLNDVDPPKKAN